MNWRIENAEEAQRINAAIDQERKGILGQRTFALSWLLWAVGPTLSHLPNLLHRTPSEILYTIRLSPSPKALQTTEFTDTLLPYADPRIAIQKRAQYESAAAIAATWGHARLEFGVVPFVRYNRTDTSQGFGQGDYSYSYSGYNAPLLLTLLTPSLYTLGLWPNVEFPVLPWNLQQRECGVAARTIGCFDGQQDTKGLVFPTPQEFTKREYQATRAAVDYVVERHALPYLFGYTYTTNMRGPSIGVAEIEKSITLEQLGYLNDELHKPSSAPPSFTRDLISL